MQLQFICSNGITPGGPNISLRHPDPNTLADTLRDGNCLFRAFSFLITGSESQHREVRSAILNHMLQNNDLFLLGNYVGVSDNHNSIAQYISTTGMNIGAWGTTVEILALSHLLRTRILSYTIPACTWQLHVPSHTDPSLSRFETDSDMAMFLYHTGNHFKVVRSIIRD